jgi:hypothetical protein
MKKALAFLLTGIFCFSAAANANPKERFQPEEVVKAIALADRLSDTEWIYSWRDHEYIFRFNPDGSIGRLESWRNVSWSVAGPEDVILDAGSNKMLLRFNNAKTTFYTVDWDGRKSDGRILKE